MEVVGDFELGLVGKSESVFSSSLKSERLVLADFGFDSELSSEAPVTLLGTLAAEATEGGGGFRALGTGALTLAGITGSSSSSSSNSDLLFVADGGFFTGSDTVVLLKGAGEEFASEFPALVEPTALELSGDFGASGPLTAVLFGNAYRSYEMS